MKSLVVFFALFVVSTSASADAADFTIKGVGVSNTSESIFINVNEEVPSTSCSKTKTFRLRKADAENTFEEILSLTIAAKATGSTVSIGYDESSCYAGGTILKYVYLR